MTDGATNGRGWDRHPRGIAQDRRVKPGALRVMLALCGYADREGRCFPSQDRLANELGTTRHKVCNAISQLEDFGYLQKVRRRRDRIEYLIQDVSVSGTSEMYPKRAHVPEMGNRDVSETGNRDVPKVGTQNQTTEPDQLTRTPPDGGVGTRGTRLPADWMPTDEAMGWARQEGHPDPKRATERFRDYWAGISGNRGVKRDWLATWRNWIRKDIDDGNRNYGGSRKTASTSDRRAAIHGALAGELESEN